MESQEARGYLDELLCWIRIGFDADLGGLTEWKDKISGHIGKLADALENDGSILGATEELRFICLRSEFHDLLGQSVKAADVLKPHVVTGGDELIARVDGLRGSPPPKATTHPYND